MSNPNREIDVKSNIIEINAKTKKKNAWMKMYITEDLAQSLMRDWMAVEDDSPDKAIEDIKLVWTDKKGLTFKGATESLRELLKKDIIDRYMHDEFIDFSSDLSPMEYVVLLYNNVEYWNPDIAIKYLRNEYLSEDDIDLVWRILEPAGIAEELLNQKNEI